ncbi:MAG: AI-2E family transporter [Patescibacteria group bacterium]
MPAGERIIRIDTWSILKVIGILLAFAFLYLIRDVLMLLFAALFLAALMHPAASYLATKKIPKGLTVIAIYIVLIGVAVLVFGLLFPPFIEQSTSLVASLGKSWTTLSSGVHWVQDFSSQYGLADNLQAGIQSLESQISTAASSVFSAATNIFGGFIGLVIVLVMAYYMVVQENEARNMFHNFVPDEYKEITATILKRVEEKIGRWLVGQLALCLVIGLMYYFGLSIIGVKAALVLAVFGGFCEFIPYLGPILGAIPALLFALTESPWKALLCLVVIVIIQQFEGHVIVPKVMQKAVGLNPLVSIAALLVGAELFGIVGALLAIPVATAISAVLSELYRSSQLRRSS